MKALFFGVFAIFVGSNTLNFTLNHNIDVNAIAPLLEKQNQSYFIGGQEVMDASELIDECSSVNQDIVLPASRRTNNWNMMSKSLVDGTLDFFNFNQSRYSYRQFAYDAISKSGLLKNTVSNSIECQEPKIIENADGSFSMYTPGFMPDDNASQTNLSSARGIIGTDDRELVADTTLFPYRAAGQVLTRFNVLNNITGSIDSLYFIGTGFMEGPDLLVTAGHCLYGDVTKATSDSNKYEDYLNNPRFPDQMWYYPARNGGTDPYGGVSVERIYLEKEYYLNTQKDWGCAKLSSKIGNTTGWMGKIGNFYQQNYPLTTFGYPGSMGGHMYETSGVMTHFEDNGWYYRTNLDTEGGQSGSPYRITVNGGAYVNGIHTYSTNSYTGGIRIDGFMFAFLNSFVAGDILYSITPSDYGFADAYPTDSTTETQFVTHALSNGLVFRTRRYRTGYIQQEYIVMSSARNDIPKKEAFIEYSFNRPINRIEVDLTYWRSVSHEYIQSSNGSAAIQVKNANGWFNKFDLLASSSNLPTDRTNPTTYTIDFDIPTYVFRFYSEYHGSSYANGQNRGRLCIGNMTIWAEYDNYMPLNGSELQYDPNLWTTTSQSNNCYAYALNNQVRPGTNNVWFKQQPGEYSNTSGYPFTKQVLVNAVEQDFSEYNADFGTNLLFFEVSKNQACPVGTYKVALVSFSGDYHWYRQDYDGYWSHKPGITPVKRTDNSGNLITNPKTCDRGPYTDFLGYFAVTPWGNMYVS